MAWKAAAIASLSASLLSQSIVNTTPKAVDLAGALTNYIDECIADNADHVAIIDAIIPYYGNQLTHDAVKSMVEGAARQGHDVGLILVAHSALTQCRLCGVATSMLHQLLNEAAEHLAVDGWKG